MWICTFPVKYSWFMSKGSLLSLMLTHIVTTSTLVAGVKCQLIYTSRAVSRGVMCVKGLVLRGEVTRISIRTSALLNTKLWRFEKLQYAQNGMWSLGAMQKELGICLSFSRQDKEFSLCTKYFPYYDRRCFTCKFYINKEKNCTSLHSMRRQDTKRLKKNLIH